MRAGVTAAGLATEEPAAAVAGEGPGETGAAVREPTVAGETDWAGVRVGSGGGGPVLQVVLL